MSGAGSVNFLAAGGLAVIALFLLRRPLSCFFRVCGKVVAGLAGLAVFSHIGGLIGVVLGVNLTNALVLALLGVPGFGLLLMANWILQI